MLDKSGAVAAAADEVARPGVASRGKPRPPRTAPVTLEPRGVAQMRYQRELATQRDDAGGR